MSPACPPKPCMQVPTCDLEFDQPIPGGSKLMTARFLSYSSAPTSVLKLSAPLIAPSSLNYPECTLPIATSSALKGAALLLSSSDSYSCLSTALASPTPLKDMLTGASHPAVLLIIDPELFAEGSNPATTPQYSLFADLPLQVRMGGRLPLPGGAVVGGSSSAFT